MALFPPGKGGGEGVDYGYKGKGVTIHALSDGQGMPIAVVSTSAKASEPEQVEPLLDAVFLLNGRIIRRLQKLNSMKTLSRQ